MSALRFPAACRAALLFLVLILPTAATAGEIIDPAGDILPTFAPADFSGTPGGDLDVLLANVLYDPTAQSFTLIARFADDIGTTQNDLGQGAVYVWGFDRGGAAANPNPGPFDNIGNGNVKFNSVVAINADGTGFVSAGGVTTQLSPSDIHLNGDLMKVTFDAALLPSTGLTFSAYLWNLWPRIGLGNNNQISDFAPDNAVESVQPVPEPSSLALLAVGATFLGAVGRKRFRAG